MSRRVWSVLALFVLLLPSAQAQSFDFAPRTAYGPDPSSSMTIVWSAPAESRTHRLEWGPTAALGTETRGIQRDLGDLQVWPVYAELTGLTPGTEYHYQIRMGDAKDQVRSFRTAPNRSAEFSFLAWGDQSSPGAPQASGDAPKRVTELARQQDAAFALVLGDLAYAGTKEGWWNQFVRQASTFAATRPFMTVPGNHDLEGFGPDGYRTRFRMPSQDEDRWYAFRYGNTQFIGLDVEDFCHNDASTSGRAPSQGECPMGVNQRQVEFLEQALSAARSDPSITWIVVYHHFGVHSQGKHGGYPLLLQHWAPLYDRYEVDLVLQAHDHLYLRSKPLRDGRVVDDGTTYVVAGTGGATLYKHGGLREWEASYQDRVHGVFKASVAGPRLRGEFLSVDGQTLDSFVLERSPPADAEAIRVVPAPVLDAFVTFAAVVAVAIALARKR